MKILIDFDSAMVTIARAALQQDIRPAPNAIWVDEQTWAEFKLVESRYEELLDKFTEILAGKAAA